MGSAGRGGDEPPRFCLEAGIWRRSCSAPIAHIFRAVGAQVATGFLDIVHVVGHRVGLAILADQ